MTFSREGSFFRAILSSACAFFKAILSSACGILEAVLSSAYEISRSFYLVLIKNSRGVAARKKFLPKMCAAGQNVAKK